MRAAFLAERQSVFQGVLREFPGRAKSWKIASLIFWLFSESLG